MVSNKKRLYLALYPSEDGAEREDLKYHLAFLVGPKMENQPQVLGMRYHIRILPSGLWDLVEEGLPDVRSTVPLLVRVLIAKITNEQQLVEILRDTPILQNDPAFNYRTWVMDAVARIARDGGAVGTSQLNWEKIEARARRYAADKIVAGRFGPDKDLTRPKPTWDMLQGKEIVP
ncbi:hypothetical protein M434DRAFT_35194 [Hypoxylon sp. CO27-5]|nr:hypothetical protein M434DRAFT_35194 [Hypoxylon sp. CO27-5]